MTCLSDEAVARFTEGQLDSAARHRVNVHLDRCPTCRQLVACLARIGEQHSKQPSSATRPSLWLDDEPSVSDGDVLGRYRVRECIGRGAMGIVHRADDPVLGRSVALKLVRPSFNTPDAQRSLQAEARALARLSHPNIVRVFDVGTVADVVYIVMELVEGASLRVWLREQSRAQVEILRVFDHLAAGLSSMHASGLVHRDVKPDNVLVTPNGRVMVSDFGLAHRMRDDTVTNRSAAGDRNAHLGNTAVGTPAYMAPEQFRGESVDPASDQFSFCVALFEALSGQRPFSGRSAAQRYRRIESSDFPAAIENLPRRLRRALRRGLAPRPEDRHASMEALRRQLNPRSGLWPTGVLGGCVVVGVAASVLPGETKGPDCGGIEDVVVWTPSARAEAERAFTATNLAHAKASWETVDRALVEFDEAWQVDATIVCQRAEAPPSPCLRRQHRQARAIVDLLRTVEPATVEHATKLVSHLPVPSACMQRGGDGDSPAEEHPEIREALARAAALSGLEQYTAAATEADDALAAALAVNAPRLAAEARFEIGRAKSQHGAHTEAIPLLEDAYWAALETGDASFAASCGLELALAMSEAREFRQARSWIRRARADLDRLPYTDHALEAALARRRGDLSWRIEDFDAALTNFQAAEQHYSKLARLDPLSLASLVANQAVISASKGNNTRAQAEYRRAIAMITGAVGDDHPILTEPLNGLAGCQLRENDLAGARETYLAALRISEASFEVHHPRSARINTNLASVLLGLGELDLADEHFDRALLGWSQDGEQPHADSFFTYVGKARLARMRQDYPAARTWGLEAGALCERVYGARHSCNADVAYDLGGTAAQTQDWPEALRQARRATEIWEDALGANHPSVAAGLRNVGDALLAADNADDAAEAYERALAIVELHGDEAPLSTVLSGLAEARLMQGSYDEAETLARRALEVPLLPIHRGMVALILAKVLFAQGQRRQSQEVARDARADMVELGPHMKPYIEYLDGWVRETF